jgi:hypothetical protein
MERSRHHSEADSRANASDPASKWTGSVSDAPLTPSLERWIVQLAERRMQLERDPQGLKELAKRGF